jgi:neutral ceramidase
VQVEGAWGEGLHLVLAGLTNTYASYITTPEEYGAQRYEGGFTLYGQHTLDAYIQVWACGVCVWGGGG